MKKYKLLLLPCVLLGFLAPGCEEDDAGKDDAGSGKETVITKPEFEATLSDVTAYHVDVNGVDLDPGPSGSDVSWDFSAYDEAAVVTSTKVGQCPGSEACAEFPDANWLSLAEGEGGGYTYTKLSEKEYLMIGAMASDGIRTTYGDPETIWNFPIEYGKEFSDSYNHSGTSGQMVAGDKTIEVDGFGTLKTAAGTFPNTLRIKVTQHLVLTSPQGGHTSSVVSYIWMNKHYKGSLLLQVAFSETTLEGQTGPAGFGKSLVYTKPEAL